MQVTVRFAPSPTGRLHVGNVRAALWNWLFARKNGGTFILRIDDTDTVRSTQDHEDAIFKDLKWLGLSHDSTFRQSARFACYDAAVEQLGTGGFLYPCYETAGELDRKRKLQRSRGLPPVYDRAGLRLSASEIAAFEKEGRKPHWRFRLSQSPVEWDDLIRGRTVVDTASVSDPVLVREDGVYLYTLPSCVDDLEKGITHVIRGEDHVTNTAVQIELLRALGGGPVQFAHHSLLVDAAGQGLSKRLGSLSIENMRDGGLEPGAITSLLARLGTSSPVVPEKDLMKLAAEFDFSGISRAPARFDEADLNALNRGLLRNASYACYAERIARTGADAALWNAVRGNLDRFSDLEKWVPVVHGRIHPVMTDPLLTDAAAELVPETIEQGSWKEMTGALAERTGRKGKSLFMPLRLALTGQPHGPDMEAVFLLIGAEKARLRLRGAYA